MADDEHSHICPECGIEWDHDTFVCDLSEESYCAECLVEQIYRDEEETTDAEGTRIVTMGFSVPGPPGREPTAMELQLMKICGFMSLEEMDRHYCSRVDRSSQENTLMCNPTERSSNPPGDSKAEARHATSVEVGKGPIVLTAQLREFRKAVKYLLAGQSRIKAEMHFVDINATDSEVELVTTSSSSSFPAEVKTSGYARLPRKVFERIVRAVRMLRLDSAVVTIKPGEIRFAKLVFSHPEIEIRLIGARIADLPMDAPLPDVLALLSRFRPDEITDSGLASRVLDAQEKATKLIDRATEILEPLEIEREELSKFISERIRNKHKKRDKEE
jgi:hypothetical protein